MEEQRRINYASTINQTSLTAFPACNQFANAVMNGMGARIPPNGTGTTATMFPALMNGHDPNWIQIVWNTAVNRANAGYPTIAITPAMYDPARPGDWLQGHIAVVRPLILFQGSTIPPGMNPPFPMINNIRYVWLANTGAASIRSHNIRLSHAWRASMHNHIRFFTFIGMLPFRAQVELEHHFAAPVYSGDMLNEYNMIDDMVHYDAVDDNDAEAQSRIDD